jgi:hypothetical protein
MRATVIQSASTEAVCSECGFRVRVSATEQQPLSPPSQCNFSRGWTRCPELRPKLSEARQAAQKL